MEAMETRKTSKSYSPEVRERAVRMVAEHRGDHASEWATIASIAAKIGCTAETLRKWVRQPGYEGRRPGLSSCTHKADAAVVLNGCAGGTFGSACG